MVTSSTGPVWTEQMRLVEFMRHDPPKFNGSAGADEADQ